MTITESAADALVIDNRPPLTPGDHEALIAEQVQRLQISAEARRRLEANTEDEAGETAGATWKPIDLGPYLRGEINPPTPTLGMARSDGLRVIYPGKEHAVVGETESGKTWFVLACAAHELNSGNRVLYIHYEESDPGSTIDRLRLLGVTDPTMVDLLTFVGPQEQVQRDWLAALLSASPILVVHDGVNEAMALHCADIKAAEGASAFRRRLVVPCLDAGAATIACDHLPMVKDGSRRDAYGSVHKGNALNGARFALENTKPFGRGMAGVSHVYVTKDRPGHLRTHGQAEKKVPGKTYLGSFVVDDDQTVGPDPRIGFYAPTGRDVAERPATDVIVELIATQPESTVHSWRQLLALLRLGGTTMRDQAVRDALDDLVAVGKLIEGDGKRGSKTYQLTTGTASRGLE